MTLFVSQDECSDRLLGLIVDPELGRVMAGHPESSIQNLVGNIPSSPQPERCTCFGRKRLLDDRYCALHSNLVNHVTLEGT